MIGVSDVSLGFGSPQINSIISYLYFKLGCSTALILEPDQPEKKYNMYRYQPIILKRVYTEENIYQGGRAEYIRECAKIINKEKPDMLLIFCSFTLPVLFYLNYRPRKVIYYNIEMANAYGKDDIILNGAISGKVDLLIYPEENRARIDIRDYGHRGMPMVTVYNCTNHVKDLAEVIGSTERNGKAIYAGKLDQTNTNVHYFFGKRNDKICIDVFGDISSCSSDFIKENLLHINEKMNFYGYVENQKLQIIRKKYAYSIVMWNPVNENQLYAAPNKFFEAIADGVIPICAPHPQCIKIIKKYDCGILMKDWSYDSFCEAMTLAERIYGTQRYSEMVGNCRKAVTKELNFESQMQYIEKYL